MDERMQAIFAEFQQQIGALASSAVARSAQLAGEIAVLTKENRALQVQVEAMQEKIAKLESSNA